jgi:hypothetical protein
MQKYRERKIYLCVLLLAEREREREVAVTESGSLEGWLCGERRKVREVNVVVVDVINLK